MTAFDKWLATLRLNGRALPSSEAAQVAVAVRGLAWSMSVKIAGNHSTATLAGAIRSAPDAPSALASFTIGSGSFDAGTNKTTWTVSLAAGTGAGSTGSLPASTDGEGVIVLPAMIHITPSGGSEKLLFGFPFTLVGKV